MRMRMEMPSVLLVLHLSNLVASIKQLPGDTELSCTDDSDCIPLGHKFGCFLYRCGSVIWWLFLSYLLKYQMLRHI